jgi:RNA polymerase sigma-70 factor, ECF subfamily
MRLEERRELRALAYRMLGSADDADDAVQDVAIRAWRGLGQFEGRSGVRTWLHRITTNVCLNRLTRQPHRTVPLSHGPPVGAGDGPGQADDEVRWLGPYPGRFLVDDASAGPEEVLERAETVELAFVAALQLLSPQSRAVLILRTVLAYSARETADVLGLSVAAVNSALQRARSAVRGQTPGPSQQQVLRELGEQRVHALVRGYARAVEVGDIDALLALFHQDATWCMPPMPAWYEGRDAIAAFLTGYVLRDAWRHLVTTANGQPAVACYRWDDGSGAFVASVLDVLTIRDERIAAITAFVDPAAVVACGLPHRLPAATPATGAPVAAARSTS